MADEAAEEYVKPKPPARAMDLHTLRAKVKANDKFAVSRKSEADAIKMIVENYGTDADSATIFVRWIKGEKIGDDTVPGREAPLERLRKGCDPVTGRETFLDENEAPATESKKKKR